MNYSVLRCVLRCVLQCALQCVLQSQVRMALLGVRVIAVGNRMGSQDRQFPEQGERDRTCANIR